MDPENEVVTPEEVVETPAEETVADEPTLPGEAEPVAEAAA